MSLESCQACGKPVASDAKTCPHCGKPDPRANVSGCVVALAVMVALFVVGLIAYREGLLGLPRLRKRPRETPTNVRPAPMPDAAKRVPEVVPGK